MSQRTARCVHGRIWFLDCPTCDQRELDALIRWADARGVGIQAIVDRANREKPWLLTPLLIARRP